MDAERALKEREPMQFVDQLLTDAFTHPERLVCFSKRWSMDQKLGSELQAVLKKAADDDRKTKDRSGKMADIMAQMIFLVPDVAGLLFDLMLEDVCTTSKHNHMDLKGTFMNNPMLSVYTDKDLEKDEERSSANVHLVKATRDCNVYEVSKQRCLLPDVLDLDIIQALAYTHKASIFAKKSVQALIYGGWSGFMEQSISIRLCLELLEVLVLGGWGLTTANGAPFGRLFWHEPAPNSPREAPSAWNILAAGALRRIVDFGWKTCAFRDRFKKARSGEAGSYLKEVWNWKAYFDMVLDLDLPILFFKCIFLVSIVSDPLSGRKEMTGGEQAALCAAFFLTVLDATVFGPVRVISSWTSLSVLAMRKASNNWEVLAFVSFFAMLFFAFVLTWEIVDREQTFFAAMSLGFRGLVIGDGDGLDFLGLKAEDDASASVLDKFKMVTGIVGMVGFFSYLMNLLIAIFSNTYDQSRKGIWLHFHQARAQMMKESILGLHKFRPDGHIQNLFYACGCSRLLSKEWMLWTGLVPLLLGLVVQCLLHVSPPAGMLFYVLWLLAKFSIPFITFGAIVIEAVPFSHKDWFPADTDTLPKPHYLWVFARKDFNEGIARGDDAIDDRYDAIDDRFDSMEKRMDGMDGKIDSILDMLKSQRGC